MFIYISLSPYLTMEPITIYYINYLKSCDFRARRSKTPPQHHKDLRCLFVRVCFNLKFCFINLTSASYG